MNTRSYPIPANESSRLKALQEYKVLDTLPEQAYDNFARLAALIDPHLARTHLQRLLNLLLISAGSLLIWRHLPF